jgi:NADPH:quinone reductase-like Zn-dependent oxidoreductase
MKAVVQDRYGRPDVLHVEDVEAPVPGDDEVLVRVRAATVTQTDTHARAAYPFLWRFYAGLRRPRWRTLGIEFAGEVEAVGAAVTQFNVGDRVFGGPRTFGTHAELICVPDDGPIVRMPAGLSFEEAAAVTDGATQALATLRGANVQARQHVVIYGASGSLGTAAVQIAHHMGAHVTAVCGTDHVDLVRSLGADEVVDYRQEDFTERGHTYDAIIDAVGKYSFVKGRRALKPHGVYIATDGGRFLLTTLLFAVATRIAGGRRVKGSLGRRSKEDLELVRDMIETGAYRPVIDRRYRMDEVADAHRYVETWHKAGNVVLTIAPDPTPA